jgi:phenylpyruvate tautomerase PptA (4-oxalocrotonate tautomerase family)
MTTIEELKQKFVDGITTAVWRQLGENTRVKICYFKGY